MAPFPAALEEAMEGRQSGDSFRGDVAAGKGLWHARQELTVWKRVPLKVRADQTGPHPARVSVVQISTRSGPREAVARKVGRFNVDVDTNHPLAGKTLRFVVQVGEVREATEEELAHGHAHGAGGHQH